MTTGEELWSEVQQALQATLSKPTFETFIRPTGCSGFVDGELKLLAPNPFASIRLREQLLPTIAEFEPEVIFLSAGFDAHLDDPLASMELSDDDFEWITTEVAALGGGNLPIVSVLEGGYNVDALEGAVRAHLHALINS